VIACDHYMQIVADSLHVDEFRITRTVMPLLGQVSVPFAHSVQDVLYSSYIVADGVLHGALLHDDCCLCITCQQLHMGLLVLSVSMSISVCMPVALPHCCMPCVSSSSRTTKPGKGKNTAEFCKFLPLAPPSGLPVQPSLQRTWRFVVLHHEPSSKPLALAVTGEMVPAHEGWMLHGVAASCQCCFCAFCVREYMYAVLRLLNSWGVLLPLWYHARR
jgi:hypothetical protein